MSRGLPGHRPGVGRNAAPPPPRWGRGSREADRLEPAAAEPPPRRGGGARARPLGPAEFVDESIGFALELAGGLRIERGILHADLEVVLRRVRAHVDDTVHGAAPAPYRALDLVEGACSGWTLEEGYRAEEEAVAELLPSRQAQASLYAFDLVSRRAKRRPPGLADAAAHKVEKVGMV